MKIGIRGKEKKERRLPNSYLHICPLFSFCPSFLVPGLDLFFPGLCHCFSGPIVDRCSSVALLASWVLSFFKSSTLLTDGTCRRNKIPATVTGRGMGFKENKKSISTKKKLIINLEKDHSTSILFSSFSMSIVIVDTSVSMKEAG